MVIKMSLSDKIVKPNSKSMTQFSNFIWEKDVREAVKELQEYLQHVTCSQCGTEHKGLGVLDKIDEIFGKELTE